MPDSMTTSHYSDETCAEKLEAAGLTPVCPPEAREILYSMQTFHETCAGPQPYAAVPMIGCHNPATGEWRFAETDRLIAEYTALQRDDPRWELRNCYTCCA